MKKCSSRDAWIRALQATSTIATNPHRLLAELIDEFATTQAAAPALLSDTQSLTYSELASEANRWSRWALEHLATGDVVCLIMSNRPRYVAIWLGITRVGGIVALINTNLIGASLAHALKAASPKHVIVATEFEEKLRQAIPQARGISDLGRQRLWKRAHPIFRCPALFRRAAAQSTFATPRF